MKRFNFNNKPMIESPYPPQNSNVLWVNVDENTGKVVEIKRFKNGVWETFVQSAGNINNGANPFYIQAIEDDTTVTFLDYSRQATKISLNNTNNYYSAPESLVINSNDRLYMQFDTITSFPPQELLVTFSINKEYNAFGLCPLVNINISTPETLISGKVILSFATTPIKDASNIIIPEPEEPIDLNIYYGMFFNCSSLIAAPQSLPSKMPAHMGFRGMFAGCVALKTAPVLPAKTITTDGYQEMFEDCSSLEKVICLAESIPDGATNSWLSNVAAQGTFVKAPGVEWPTGDSGIPEGWTVEEYAG